MSHNGHKEIRAGQGPRDFCLLVMVAKRACEVEPEVAKAEGIRSQWAETAAGRHVQIGGWTLFLARFWATQQIFRGHGGVCPALQSHPERSPEEKREGATQHCPSSYGYWHGI